jgi:hypothetical protein
VACAIAGVVPAAIGRTGARATRDEPAYG